MRRLLTAILVMLAAGSATAAGVHGYAGLTLSPDGDRIATVEQVDRHAAHPVVVIRDGMTGHILQRIDPCASCRYSDLRFAADGRLAFLSRDRDAGRVTLYLARDGAAKPVARIDGLAQDPRFAPDGKRIAMLITLGATKETGATQPGARQTGEIGEHADAQQLTIVDLDRSTVTVDVRPISPSGRFIYEYDWTPDGRALIVSSAAGDGDANWWVASLDRVDAITGALTAVARPATQFRYPRVSPDGQWIAYIGGLMSDYGSVGGDVWRVPVAGGTPQNLTTGERRTYTELEWTGTGLRAATLEGDKMGAAAIEPGRGGRPLFALPVALGAGDGRIAWTRDGGKLATVVQDYTHAPAIFAGAPAAPRRLTHDNDDAPANVVARSVTWRSGGYDVQGWLLSPLNAKTGNTSGRAPMIVSVHGGPSAASSPRYLERGAATYLLDAGYHVFYPNPRGSYGQGAAFTAANKRDFGGGDLDDILAGIDAVERIAPVDDQRLGLTGCSYGGFMAMFANTRTDRFKAIVAGAGISNWISYYGTNGIDQWMLPFFGKSAYDDLAAYERVSAVYRVARAKTPTFIYVGERDIEVPPTQSVEWWKALKANDVPASLVIYPDAGHCVTGADQSADVRKRALAWFDRYLAR